MDGSTTYDVRVYRTEVYEGTKVTTYKVRWRTAHRLWKEGFRNAALADSFRSSLLAAARKGEAFSLRTGRPLSWEPKESTITWYALTLDYTAAKWPYAAPNHRKSIAEALTDATEAMLASAASSSTVRAVRPAQCPSILSWSRSSASTSRNIHPARTGASSLVPAAASSTTGPT